MRFIVFFAIGTVVAATAANCVACNGRGGGGGATSSVSFGTTGLASLRAGNGLTTGSPFASMATSGAQQGLLQQLAFERMLQQQLAVSQQMPQQQSPPQTA